MPFMDGIALLREALAIDADLVSIVMTGHGAILPRLARCAHRRRNGLGPVDGGRGAHAWFDWPLQGQLAGRLA
jgi:hypothetical protein